MGSSYWLAEVLLALAALLVANQYWYLARERSQSPALLVVAGCLALALAAFVGAYRYGVDPQVTELHRALSRLSGFLTFSSIGLALLWVYFAPAMGRQSRAPAYVALVLLTGSALGAMESGLIPAGSVSSLWSSIGLAGWLAVALLARLRGHRLSRGEALLLAAGPVLVIVASTIIGTGPSRLLGLARMNWFHLLLALGVMTLLWGRPLFEIADRKSHESK
ncbi:hypothetical protein AWR36_011965 [Microbulbifer flavimaris]|uniref:Uncharacterized protein n=1 Tax=Microbulbifer flavimaris TaxID=1781068 RepID=A0ABX4HX65_9GAMM|nr:MULTISPECIES: hypothetical protein [Microbulbifer]KUJ82509.1 hypothetical protein AVO43_11930 [Microbulbifer sp. ZGT114]PCO04715.1 hypothetical protein AWR36_011965 [Microbulbifer flavimaris]